MIAGVVAEEIFVGHKRRCMPEEVRNAHRLCETTAEVLGRGFEEVLTETYDETRSALLANEDAVLAIAEELDEGGWLNRKRLSNLLARVYRSSDETLLFGS